MSRYIELADLRDYLGFTGTQAQAQDGIMQDCIDRAESGIDAYTRRNFVGTAGTYYVNRFGQRNVVGQALYLDRDLHSLSGVINGDGQTIPVGSVWLEPQNEHPKRIVRLKSSYVWVWNTDSDLIISGTFGYGTTPPDDIKQATVRYAAWLFRQKDIGGVPEASGFPEAGEQQFPRGIPDDVRYLLSPYRSRSGGAV